MNVKIPIYVSYDQFVKVLFIMNRLLSIIKYKIYNVSKSTYVLFETLNSLTTNYQFIKLLIKMSNHHQCRKEKIMQGSIL